LAQLVQSNIPMCYVVFCAVNFSLEILELN